jgi:hypothetical protein
MSEQNLLGLGRAIVHHADAQRMEHVLVERPLSRVLAFTGCTIDDLINDPFARRKVLGYYKLHCWVRRECQISELERQWTPLGLR